VVHQEQYVHGRPEGLPLDVVPVGYFPCVVQDLIVAPHNTRFFLQAWYSASEHTTYHTALPPGYEGEFGPGVRTLVEALRSIGNVSEPCIHQLVESVGISISSGTVSNMLIKNADLFHAEYDSVFRAGLESSPWQCTDHTTSPVNGKLYQCQVTGNTLYTAYATTLGKGRRSITHVLLNRTYSTKSGAGENGPLPAYLLDKRAYEYLFRLHCPRRVIDALKKLPQDVAFCEDEFYMFLTELVAPALSRPAVKQPLSDRRLNQICDAAAISFYRAQKEWPVVDTLLADGASAFEQITRGLSLCWVHEGRLYKKLAPHLQHNCKALARFLTRFWKYYDALLLYRKRPTAHVRRALDARFDKLFSTVTGYSALDARISATLAKKEALLMVLEHPELPLHNNDCELAARARVRKRDVSLQTRTPEGTRSWDTFMTLAATARKLGVNFFDYLRDRISKTNEMPSLASLITQRAATMKLGASWNTS
jgi:hypothetical protein